MRTLSIFVDEKSETPLFTRTFRGEMSFQSRLRRKSVEKKAVKRGLSNGPATKEGLEFIVSSWYINAS